jgi:DNA polymerase
MSDAFQQALESTVQYLGRLRDQGVRYTVVAPETLKALATPPSRGRSAVGNDQPAPKGQMQGSVVGPGPMRESTAAIEGLSGVVAVKPALDPAAKEAAMEELRSRVLGCERCPRLAAARTQVVFGVGSVHSPLMFVGEAPGADEDRQGEPFVGRAGQLLTKIIETMGLSRDRVYIGNVLKCRPDTPGQRTGNRKPTADEMKTCLPYLLEQIDIIQPKVLVALGATAVEGLFGKAMPITRIRGQWREFHGIPAMPTYHPAYLLRNQSLTEKRKVWEDMLQVMERLSMPITPKQRNYFLQAGA